MSEEQQAEGAARGRVIIAWVVAPLVCIAFFPTIPAFADRHGAVDRGLYCRQTAAKGNGPFHRLSQFRRMLVLCVKAVDGANTISGRPRTGVRTFGAHDYV